MTDVESGIWCEGSFIGQAVLRERARRAAQLFSELGVQPGSTVALMLRNCVAALEVTLGAQHLGAYAVPVNWHFTGAEVAYVLKDSAARVLVIHADLLAKIEAELPAGIAILVVGGAGQADGRFPLWDDAVLTHSPATTEAAPILSNMFYTSGTTGRPKGVRRSAATSAEAAALEVIRRQLYAPETGMRSLLSAPLYHAAPIFFALYTVRNDGLLILESKFDAERTLQAIEKYRITHLYMVPTMFVRLLALPAEVRNRYDTSSLRWVLHSGAPCAPDVKAAMIAWWGPVIAEYYGSTETGPLTFIGAEDWLTRPGTAGRPLPGITLSIRDEAGELCPQGEPGEIFVGENCQPDFTYHGDEAKRQSIDKPYGLASGDVGYLDEGGYLFICDRRTDMIISGGVNIYPAEIEAALIAIPGIRDCAVIGKPDPEYGEMVVACIQLEPGAAGLSDAEILSALRERIAGYKLPRKIVKMTELPREDSGKIFKRRLKEKV